MDCFTKSLHTGVLWKACPLSSIRPLSNVLLKVSYLYLFTHHTTTSDVLANSAHPLKSDLSIFGRILSILCEHLSQKLSCGKVVADFHMFPPTVIKLREGEKLHLYHTCVFTVKHNCPLFTAVSSTALLEGCRQGRQSGSELILCLSQ